MDNPVNKPNKEILFGKTLADLSEIVSALGMPRFTAGQIASWMYKKGASGIDEMTDISVKNRNILSKQYEVGLRPPVSVAVSSDGTKKYLFETLSGSFIESAYIPDRDRATLCVSSQAGCRMGCTFCMTGRGGLEGNLTSGEILNQVRSIPESDQLTNIVYMGMGEPLDNTEEVLKSLDILTSDWGYGWSPTRITVSTIGVVPELRKLLELTKVHLAVSLHNPFSAERSLMMPVEKAWPAEKVIQLLREYDFTHQRRVSFEYIVFEGINDTTAHMKELVRILNGMKCRINLIRFHRLPGSPYRSPGNETMVRLRDFLTSKGIVTTIRTSRGEDIQAACGLLSGKKRIKP